MQLLSDKVISICSRDATSTADAPFWNSYNGRTSHTSSRGNWLQADISRNPGAGCNANGTSNRKVVRANTVGSILSEKRSATSATHKSVGLKDTPSVTSKAKTVGKVKRPLSTNFVRPSATQLDSDDDDDCSDGMATVLSKAGVKVTRPYRSSAREHDSDDLPTPPPSPPTARDLDKHLNEDDSGSDDSFTEQEYVSSRASREMPADRKRSPMTPMQRLAVVNSLANMKQSC